MHTTVCKGTSDKIVDICRKAGVQPVFQQTATLRGLLALKSEGMNKRPSHATYIKL